MVTVLSFVILLAFNATYVLLLYMLHYESVPGLMPNKASIIRFSVLYTAAYGLIMLLAIRLKRDWRRNSEVNQARPENLLIAIYSYVFTVPINIIISLYMRNWQLTYAPFLFALNQAVFGYFIGKYVDKSLSSTKISVAMAFFQGCAQAIVAVIATQLSPTMIVSLELGEYIFLGAFSVIQAAVSGLIVGLLFQYFYKRTDIRNINEGAGAPRGSFSPPRSRCACRRPASMRPASFATPPWRRTRRGVATIRGSDQKMRGARRLAWKELVSRDGEV